MKCVTAVIGNPEVRTVVRAMLQRDGFVWTESSGCKGPEFAPGCDLTCAGGADPDLMVIEVIVPRCCSGVRVAEKALRRWPNVKILLTSASSPDTWPADVASEFEALPGDSVAFLAKPFTATQMRATVGNLLGTRT
jgi:CheY-like chemotaxis protein